MKYILSYYHKVPQCSVKYKSKLHEKLKIGGKLHTEMITERVAIHTDLSIDKWNEFVFELVKIDQTATMMQLEEGSFPTSYIHTDGAAETRAADVLSYSDGVFDIREVKIEGEGDNAYIVFEPQRTNHIINQPKIKE